MRARARDAGNPTLTLRDAPSNITIAIPPIAIPLDALTVFAPLPELLSQRNVESVTGIPARTFHAMIRASGFPLPVSRLGKLRLVDRAAFVSHVKALATHDALEVKAADEDDDEGPDLHLLRAAGYELSSGRAGRGR
jgi:hypothetical protein